MAEQAKQETTKRRVRPNEGQRFPYIPLQRAIERAKELYTLTNTHDVHMKTAVKHWGYGDKSSGGLQTTAALKAFGLIADDGSNEARKIKLTDIALKIIRDPREISPERDALIKQAALNPPIHREILDKYQGLPPSDETFKAYLLLDKGMKEDSASACAKEFTATMSFAKVTDSATLPEMDDGENASDSGNDQGVKSPTPPKPPTSHGGKLMEGERVIFTEETQPKEYLRLIASGEINGLLLEALEDFIKRQKKRLKITSATA